MAEVFDFAVIGGGAAGIAAARELWNSGSRSVVLIDRKTKLGGILLQCAHTGFGNGLNGPAYASLLAAGIPEELPVRTGVTVTEIRPDRAAMLSDGGFLRFNELVLATGAREIPLGALPITGTRPRGVYTAGQMQEMLNCYGYVPEKVPAVILGGGDIGLILAWQLAGLGLPVTVVEKDTDYTGLTRNRDRIRNLDVKAVFGVTAIRIEGMPSITNVILSNGTVLPCGMLLIAAGLRPERELLAGLGTPDWVHFAGNCDRIYPVIDQVIRQGGQAAWDAIRHMEKERAKGEHWYDHDGSCHNG